MSFLSRIFRKRTKTATCSVNNDMVNPTGVPVVTQPPCPAGSYKVNSAQPGLVVTPQSSPGKDEAEYDAKYRAAAALNLCMVSLSQIVDYNDINILRMEYESILNNINFEIFPKDDALHQALKQILDTCHFYILHEKDKELLKKKQALRLKNGLSGINFFVVSGGGNPYAMAASIAMMIGVAAVNYKVQKEKANYENEAEEWELEKSALEQLHLLRATLFSTAWRLAETYCYKDEWRLSEKQIEIYNKILTKDPLPRYNQLETIQNKFEAYPLFFYYMAHAAIEAVYEQEQKAKKEGKQPDGNFRKAMYSNAKKALTKFKTMYSKAQLLREDLVAASAYLDWCEITEPENRKEILEALKTAQKLAGLDASILQNCTFRYLALTRDEKGRIDDEITKDAEQQAIQCLKILLSHESNISLNARLLSRLYIIYGYREEYDTLFQIISNRSTFVYRHILPWEENALPENSYEKECREFFSSDRFSYILFRFFECKIEPAVAGFVESIRISLHEMDTTSLVDYCETDAYKKIEYRIGSALITSFEDLGNRFSGKDNAVLRKISSRRINRNYYDAILKTFKNVKERIESDSTGTFGGSYKGKDDQDAFNRLENEFEGMKKSLFEIAYQQQSVISDQLLNKDADLEEQLTFLDYLEGEIAKYRSDLRKRKPRFPVEETSFEDFVSEISKRKKIKQMLFNISEEKNINTKLWLTFEQMRQELKDQAEHEQGN